MNVDASFQLVVTDNLFHKLKGLDHSMFLQQLVIFVKEGDGVVIFQETGSAVY